MTSYDAYTAREVDRMSKFAKWLSGHGHAGKGLIGEFGWPNFPGAVKEDVGGKYQQGSLDAWNKLGAYYIYALAKNQVAGTYWATGEYWGSDYGKLCFDGNPVSKILPAGQVLIDSPVPVESKGVNLSQHEFEQSMGWPTAKTVQFLAGKGIKFFRVPFGWEDLQPSFGAELVSGQVTSLKAFLDACQSNGCTVVLDCHNYGIHSKSGQCDGSSLSNLWVKMAAAVGAHPAVVGFDTMNEPNSENMSWSESAGFGNWAQVTQQVVTALRQAGFQKRIYLETYQWSGIDQFAAHFPNGPWATDPLNNTYYEAHHYFDTNGSSSYNEEYSAGLNKATSAGYKPFDDTIAAIGGGTVTPPDTGGGGTTGGGTPPPPPPPPPPPSSDINVGDRVRVTGGTYSGKRGTVKSIGTGAYDGVLFDGWQRVRQVGKQYLVRARRH